MKLVISTALLLITILVVTSSTTAGADDLSADLKEFWDLVPLTRIRLIAGRHLIFDRQFRAAKNYLQSDEFMQELKRLAKTPAVKAIYAYVSKFYDLEALIEKIPGQFRKLHLQSDVADPTALPIYVQRDFSSFVRDAVAVLPRSEITSLIASKVQKGGDFAGLYKALRAPEFEALVDKAMKTPGLWDELEKHHINVNELVDVAFEVLKWGP